MQFSNILSIFALASAASAVSVSYDTGFDDGSRSLTAVSCSDGPNGLMSRFGWQTQGQIPRFPYIGGAPAVGGWNSPGVSVFFTSLSFQDIAKERLRLTHIKKCGTCWRLSWNGRSINVLAIDRAAGFNIALDAMNALTNGQAVNLGRVEADAQQVDASQCGL
ncbi:SnodProt1 [Magnaporthiopsis poae ATCC 64411]|uniref:SnodProt1 n=1 Tax=Magnaporthiopsis poae (strain ATCC 64411 / 73-15) TaxID=644358 RepID=A0A0C4DW91_MAGP6|nr:SnodProt1 [Magnaporthiopsis poae ATCC 64411]